MHIEEGWLRGCRGKQSSSTSLVLRTLVFWKQELLCSHCEHLIEFRSSKLRWRVTIVKRGRKSVCKEQEVYIYDEIQIMEIKILLSTLPLRNTYRKDSGGEEDVGASCSLRQKICLRRVYRETHTRMPFGRGKSLMNFLSVCLLLGGLMGWGVGGLKKKLWCFDGWVCRTHSGENNAFRKEINVVLRSYTESIDENTHREAEKAHKIERKRTLKISSRM